MNLAPDTTTIEAQRNTELLLLDYLRSTNPHIYALWCDHADYNNKSDDSSGDSSSSSSSGGSAPSPYDDVPYQEATFHRAAHEAYASAGIQHLPSALQGMYPSRPWVAYWCLQAADLLGVLETELLAHTPAASITAFLHSCLSRDGTCEAELRRQHASPADNETDAEGATARPAVGFAGGPVHLGPHLASSYAACCALAVLAAHDGGASLRRLPRAAIKRWLLTLRNPDGSFRVHGGGESDIRASYCAAVLTTLLSLDDPATFEPTGQRRRGLQAQQDSDDDESDGPPREYVADVQYEPVLTLQTARFVAACQTHEGGFTCSSTASEAHGAYTQCGLAALLLMRQPHLVHQASLRRWLAARQLSCEGGFNGRTNKLVDSCYSHWIGASHVLLRTVEAYTKCFAKQDTAFAGVGEEEEKEEEKESETAAFLRAREVLLLDSAQLLDATLIQSTETAAWDSAESAHFTRVDLVDQFLCADDACMREAANKRAASEALFDDVMRAHKQASSAVQDDGDSGGDGGGADVETMLRLHHAHQAFLHEDVGDYYFNQRKLQDYVLRCCQSADIGGLMDKPGTAHDAYHTCYSLSGISAAQNLQYLAHASAARAAEATAPSSSSSPTSYLSRAFAKAYLPKRAKEGGYGAVMSIPGPSREAETALLRTTNPIFNLHQSAVLAALKVWGVKSFL